MIHTLIFIATDVGAYLEKCSCLLKGRFKATYIYIYIDNTTYL
jgi:hypothetical protein